MLPVLGGALTLLGFECIELLEQGPDDPCKPAWSIYLAGTIVGFYGIWCMALSFWLMWSLRLLDADPKLLPVRAFDRAVPPEGQEQGGGRLVRGLIASSQKKS